MLKYSLGCLCLAGWLLFTAPGCDGPGNPQGTTDPTSDFETQTRHHEAYDQQPHQLTQ
jgi:hypothetical protein